MKDFFSRQQGKMEKLDFFLKMFFPYQDKNQ